MSTKRRMIFASVVLAACVGAAVFAYSYRALRLWRIAESTRAQIRYLIENGGTIGEIPASQAFSADYLQAIFGSDPRLLAELQSVVEQGLADTPVLNLGEVTAMIVTYRKTEQGEIKDVVAHVLGGFPMEKRKPGFHRDGYFRQLIDPNLWTWGNSFVGLLGRELVLFGRPEVVEAHQELLDASLAGNILPLADSLSDPLFYSAVFPNPRGVVARQLRAHIQAVVVKGFLAMYEGSNELIVLTPSAESGRYTLAVMSDMKVAAEVALKTKWRGVERPTPWGPIIDPWWSYEMVNALEKDTVLERDQNVIRVKTTYADAMVNVVLKCVERMGRDMAAMRGTLDERLDPRIVDARMQTRKPLHYWSEEHRWGPYWPIMSRDTNVLARQTANRAAAAEAAAAAPAATPEPAPETATP